MPTKKQFLINHICLTIRELSTLIAAIELGDLTDEQIITGINKNADLLRINEE